MASPLLVTGTVAMMAAISTVGVAAAIAAPRPGQPVIAVFSPLSPPGSALAAAAHAGAALLDIGRRDWMVVVRADGAAMARLAGTGAWIIVDARFASFCMKPASSQGYSR